MSVKKWMKGLFVCGIVCGLSTTAYAAEVPIQLLGVNDFHGALTLGGTAYMPEGKISNTGGAAKLATALDNARDSFLANAQNGQSIRVQAGDMVGASPANSALLQDEPTVRIFNRMKFEFGTLGNHEFDEGLEEFNRILTGQAPEPNKFYSIVDNYPHEASNMTLVIGNVVDKSGAIPFNWKPYAIKEIEVNNEKVKIGFIGVVTTEIPNLVLKKNYENYTYLDEAETIVKYARELRENGVNAIVVLAHVPSTSKDDVAQFWAADMIKKVNALDPDNSVDVVFAGHNHVYTSGVAEHTRIVQALSQGKAYADVQGVYDTTTGDFKSVPTGKVTAVTSDLPENNEVKALVDEATALAKQVTDSKIGTAETNQPITRELSSTKESAVGNLVTDAQRAIAKLSGYAVDFAMTNNGGIRADLAVQEDGSITWGAAQAVQPFGNILQVVSLTGQQIVDALNQQYDEEERYFLQVSGLRYEYTDADDNAEGIKYKVHKVYTEDGQPLDLTKTYKVVINDFLYGGGDGFSVFPKATLLGAIDPDTEVFVQYIKNLEAKGEKVSSFAEGRKVYKSKEDIEKARVHETGAPAFAEEKPIFRFPFIRVPSTTTTVAVSEKSDAKTKEVLLPKTGEHQSFVILFVGTIFMGASLRILNKNKKSVDR
ncbi:LPXTG cell wall anchor domain-containing protein [Granulicatella sp. zg-ZJ]|uniref:5'-nucleotidase C-terminal domain-containing protein n=1 Tax=Granulicatella sp. zg-ZJ TaxID=2678504 RepID=UPI0013D087BA|nr:LPXTG cell wall anchor domain-containing protein [Granulicatella sp. zg-ZJ]